MKKNDCGAAALVEIGGKQTSKYETSEEGFDAVSLMVLCFLWFLFQFVCALELDTTSKKMATV